MTPLLRGSALEFALVALLCGCSSRCATDREGAGRAEVRSPLGMDTASSAGTDERTERTTPRASVGVNLGEVVYYGPQVAFLDLVQQAQDWGLASNGRPPPVDAHGWPTALPGGAAGFIAQSGPGGRFVAIYEGIGDLQVSHGGRILASRPGRLEMQLEPGDVHFRIVRLDPANPLRELHIVPAEHEGDFEERVFHPRFVELVRPFGVLRFLDWSRINGSAQARWSERPRPDDFSQGTEKGVALEYTIELCNRARADCWFNIPHRADDEYVARYAEMVRDRLDPSLRAYVEYSNEIWNFEHGNWCQSEGVRLGMPDEWDTRLRYQAHRSLEIFRVFERALGRERLVRVLAGQMWDVRLRILLEWQEAHRSADAVAVAPYFCGRLSSDEHVAETRRLDAAELARRCGAEIAGTMDELRQARDLARSFGLPLIAYEGGQHLATSGAHHEDEALQRLLDDANRHPEMGRAYTRYLEEWRDEVGGPMVLYELAYRPSKWGRWGLLEDMWQPLESAPKYQSAVAFARSVASDRGHETAP
jgi:hypothetical protein